MNKTNFLQSMKGSLGRAGLQMKKRSPEILIAAGIVGTIASTVLACKATTKIDEVLEETKDKVDKIHQCLEDGTIEGYSAEDGKKDLTIVYSKTGVKLAKLYAPSVILGALSITSIVASNNILRKRNVAIAAAYAAIDKSFKGYRSRVIERFGEQVDRELKYNIKAETIEGTVLDENGNEVAGETTVEIIDPSEQYSPYIRIFDELNNNWKRDASMNMVFLKQQQNYANDLLRARGHLFLNEVYDMLGFPRCKAGQIVGWIYDPENKHRLATDNYVDFGIYNFNEERCRDFINGCEKSIILDFNVDGVVYDLI